MKYCCCEWSCPDENFEWINIAEGKRMSIAKIKKSWIVAASIEQECLEVEKVWIPVHF